MLLEVYIISKTHFFKKHFLFVKINLIILRNSRNIILKLGLGIRNSILKFITQSANSFFNSYNPKGIKFITRLWLGLSHLREHKFKHSFQDSLNTFCNCGLDIESTAYYLLHCSTCFIERRTLLSTIIEY